LPFDQSSCPHCLSPDTVVIGNPVFFQVRFVPTVSAAPPLPGSFCDPVSFPPLRSPLAHPTKDPATPNPSTDASGLPPFFLFSYLYFVFFLPFCALVCFLRTATQTDPPQPRSRRVVSLFLLNRISRDKLFCDPHRLVISGRVRRTVPRSNSFLLLDFLFPECVVLTLRWI